MDESNMPKICPNCFMRKKYDALKALAGHKDGKFTVIGIKVHLPVGPSVAAQRNKIKETIKSVDHLLRKKSKCGIYLCAFGPVKRPDGVMYRLQMAIIVIGKMESIPSTKELAQANIDHTESISYEGLFLSLDEYLRFPLEIVEYEELFPEVIEIQEAYKMFTRFGKLNPVSPEDLALFRDLEDV